MVLYGLPVVADFQGEIVIAAIPRPPFVTESQFFASGPVLGSLGHGKSALRLVPQIRGTRTSALNRRSRVGSSQEAAQRPATRHSRLHHCWSGAVVFSHYSPLTA